MRKESLITRLFNFLASLVIHDRPEIRYLYDRDHRK